MAGGCGGRKKEKKEKGGGLGMPESPPYYSRATKKPRLSPGLDFTSRSC